MKAHLAIDIEPTWAARVMLTKGKTTVTRKVEAPAHDVFTAKSRMEYALKTIWADWEVVWLTQPQEAK